MSISYVPPSRALARLPMLVALFLSSFAALLTAAPSSAGTLPRRSIGDWVSCSGSADDSDGASAAFAAARHNAFILVVDCPVRLHSGVGVDKSIFIDSGTSVDFTGDGKFIVDNLFHPAFVIANSNEITLTDWNVEWQGSVPVDPHFSGYEIGGRFVSGGGDEQPASAFNNLVLTPWLQAHRSIDFDGRKGYITAIWPAGPACAAVFFITGSSADVAFNGMKLYVPAGAAGHQFMPMAFSMSSNWRSSAHVDADTPHTVRYVAVPQGLTFSNIDLDGTLMGWNGNLQNSTFENITSHRYGDLQDAHGNHVGGIGKWFPPPHLFYLNYGYDGDPKLFNSNIHITSVSDAGPRVGVARDQGGSDPGSGNASSLKLGCYDCSVDHYGSTRPDGFMDVLASRNLTVSNVYAAFDSAFLHNLYSGGMRFTIPGYRFVTFENLQLVDQAANPVHQPIGNAYNAGNTGFVFKNVRVTLNSWTERNLPLPTIVGVTNDVALNYAMSAQSTKLSHVQLGTVSTTFQTSPTNLRAGGSTTLRWSSTDAERCEADGAWAGNVGTGGSKVVKLPHTGTYTFTLTCADGKDSSPAAVVVSVH